MKKILAVIDTNVLISSLLSKKDDTSTVQVLENILNGRIIPLFNNEILNEYFDVLHRKKFNFPDIQITALLDAIEIQEIYTERTTSLENFPDPKDIAFYEVALSRLDDNAYLVTGNIKHFPNKSFVITPAEMLKIIIKTHTLEGN